jgi:predicted oxidoreductase
VRAFVAVMVVWSAIVLSWVLLVPASNGGVLGCMHLVGRSVACEAQQDAVNQAWWQYHTLPMILAIAAGYVGIMIVRLRGARIGA